MQCLLSRLVDKGQAVANLNPSTGLSAKTLGSKLDKCCIVVMILLLSYASVRCHLEGLARKREGGLARKRKIPTEVIL